MEENKTDMTVVEVGPDGVKLHGVYEDFRPAMQTVIATVNHVLKLTENIVGLPADFLNHHLGRFRDRFHERVEAIPPQDRILPPIRIGCVVLNQVAYAADEPKFQEMFADLLASASDRRTRDSVHPSFATIINELSSDDCRTLVFIKTVTEPASQRMIAEAAFNGDEDAARLSMLCLIRLGLTEWHYPKSRLHPLFESQDFASKFSRGASTLRLSGSDFRADDARRGLESAARDMYQKIYDDVNRRSKPLGVYFTQYGWEFVKVCFPGGASGGVPPASFDGIDDDDE
jgi:hypothetical protein